ncbi:ABC transporter permease [Polymorphospora sp. NPDC051019]|uniref:ABC transporter permease n=1 Tax=Polymorphospora sp. NPDC051019 TaxID=3155725 RepID=UPI003418935F
MNRPLLRLALAGLRAHAVRLLLTAAAVVVGVSFLAGTLVYGDTARAAFYDDLARSARNVDVVVEPRPTEMIETGTVDRVRAVEGVAAVDGRTTAWLGMLDRDGRLLMNSSHIGYALSLPTVDALAPYDVTAGRLPAAAGEVAVEQGTLDRARYAVGDVITVVDRAGEPHPLTVVGALDLGVNRLYGGSSVLALTTADLTGLTTTQRYSQVVVTARPGTDPAVLRDRIAAAVDPNYDVITGDRLRDRLARDAAKYVDGFLAVLIGFGLVSLTVSGFVIYNTFAILAAQRTRELALLRCVGATRRQVAGSVLLEALLLGVVASVGGLVASLLVGYGLIWGRELVATDIPLHAPVVRWPTVAVALGFGTFVAVASALVPALGAGRVSPLTALRDSTLAEKPAGRGRTVRVVVAAALAGTGLLAGAAGLTMAFAGLPLVLGGGMLVFLGTVVAAPLLVPAAVRAVGWLPARIFGSVPGLAVAGARRNPRRAAATTMALMIGVALMSMFSVLLATAREQTGRELEENFPVEFVLRNARVDGAPDARRGPLPPELAGVLAARPEFATVAEVRLRHELLDDRLRVWSVPAEQLRGPIVPEVVDGDIAGLRPGTVAVSRRLADARALAVGDPVPLGTLGTLTVVAVYDDAPTEGAALVAAEQFDSVYGPSQPDELLVDLAPGVTTAVGRQAIDAVLRDHPVVQVSSQADQTDRLTASLDELLGIFAALLGMSVLIALFGIGNTLSLSVFERARESATMRALGMSRRQLRAVLLTEAALVAAVGALAGVLLGVSVGWAAATGLISAYGHGLPVVPVGQLGLFVALAAGAGVLAALLPARRAARAPIVTAMADHG